MTKVISWSLMFILLAIKSYPLIISYSPSSSLFLCAQQYLWPSYVLQLLQSWPRRNVRLDIDFSLFLLSSDIESLWCDLKNIIYDAICLFVPTVPVCRHSHPPWFNSHIRHSINILRSLWRQQKSNPTTKLQNKISLLESQLQLEISSTKMQLESDLVHYATKNASNVFQYIRSITGSSWLPLCCFLMLSLI